MGNFYFYNITIYDSYANKEEIHKGLVFAGSYSDAVKNICEDYGADHLCKINLLAPAIVNGEDVACIEIDECEDTFKEYDKI